MPPGSAHIRKALPLIATAALLIAPAGARGEVVARTGNVPEQHVSAHAGKVVFSARRPSGRFVLMVHENGRTTRVPVRSRRRAGFDVDLGPGPDGGTVAVYSRCELRGRFRDCDVYRYDFRTRRERLVASVSTRGGSETQPAIWRSRLAFARRTRRAFEPQLRVWHRGDVQRVRGGSHNDPEEDAYPPVVDAVDLVGTRLAFVWEYRPGRCAPNEDDPLAFAREVFVQDLGSGRRRIAEGCDGDVTTGFPSVALGRRSAFFTYADDQTYDPDTTLREVHLRRVNLRTGAVADSQEQLFGPVALVRGEVFVAQRDRIERLRPTFVEVTAPTFDE